MIRLLGAITGSALALAALLVLVGVPQFKAEPKAPERPVVTLPLRTEPMTSLLEIPNPEGEVLRAERTSEAESGTETEIETTIEGSPEAVADSDEDIVAPVEPIQEALQPNTPQWYAFWSPFRSEIAASGFVAQLQRVTGLDFRVVKLEPGVYEVAFAYAADEDIPINLSQISAATGLDLPGN